MRWINNLDPTRLLVKTMSPAVLGKVALAGLAETARSATPQGQRDRHRREQQNLPPSHPFSEPPKDSPGPVDLDDGTIHPADEPRIPQMS